MFYLPDSCPISEKSLQRGIGQNGACQQPLELGVLVLERAQTLRLGHLQAAIFCLPVVDRRFRHAVSPGQIGCLGSRLDLLEHPDDLLFREPCSLHSSVLLVRPDSKSRMRSEEHTSELQSLMRIPYAVSCLEQKPATNTTDAPKLSAKDQLP